MLMRAAIVYVAVAVAFGLAISLPLSGVYWATHQSREPPQGASAEPPAQSGPTYIVKERDEYWEKLVDPVALATLALAITTFFMVRVIREQVRLAREEFLATHRPKIRVRMVTVRPLITGQRIEVQYNVTNVGGSAATILWATASVQVPQSLTMIPGVIDPNALDVRAGNHLPERPFIRVGETHLVGPIDTGLEYDGSGRFEPASMVVRGEVFYRDNNQIERRTSFERVHDRRSGRNIHRFSIPPKPDPDAEYED
jgi:hypothetical protein